MNQVHLTLFMIMSYFLWSLEIITNKSRKIFTLLIIMLFIFLASYRSIHIPDTLAYANSYHSLSLSNVEMSYFEIGFTIYSALIKFISGGNLTVYFGIITATNLLLIYKGLEKINTNKLILPIILYISYYGIYFNFIVLRAGLAFSLLFYAYSIFYENRIKSVVFFLLACTFHQSAVVGIIGYFIIINSKKFSNNAYFFWFLLIIIMYFLRVDIFFYDNIHLFLENTGFLKTNHFGYYFDNIKFTSGISNKFIFNYILGIFMISVRKYYDVKYQNVLNIYMVGLTIISLFSSFLWIERISDYFIAFSFIILTKAIYTFKDKGVQLLISMIVVFFNLLFIFRIM